MFSSTPKVKVPSVNNLTDLILKVWTRSCSVGMWMDQYQWHVPQNDQMKKMTMSLIQSVSLKRETVVLQSSHCAAVRSSLLWCGCSSLTGHKEAEDAHGEGHQQNKRQLKETTKMQLNTNTRPSRKTLHACTPLHTQRYIIRQTRAIRLCDSLT